MTTTKTTNTASQTYTATLYLWSEIGHTPITNRDGAYCDKLTDDSTVAVTDPEDARRQLAELASKYPDAAKGCCHIPNFPNQNVRTEWVSGRRSLLAN